uniref:DJ-1/PfpI family protein n=1 Tax=uncultured Dysgonomonas sp. TaxID=206096 RepID=UPI00258F9EEF|nr:DJ-1/PfpI family protein [uncultured Dysgonomonas sp.]
MQNKKVLVFLAKAFETMEFCVFIDILGWARVDYGHNLLVDTCGFTEKVISTFNIPVMVDKTIGEINVDEYDALAIPGGFEEFGFYEEAYNERFLELIKEFDAKGKIIATVCTGALPLGKSGILKNRKATTYHLNNGYRQKELKEFGVNVVNERIVVDGNIITSYCPETAPSVAFELLKMLTSEEDMSAIKKAMGFEEEEFIIQKNINKKG